MRSLFVSILLLSLSTSAPCFAQEPQETAAAEGSARESLRTEQERNKELARGFYEDLWFSENTDRYSEYVAPEYIAHDIGDRKNVTETGIAQKQIADFFHANGNMSGSIDFQIAEGDLVATRWQWDFEPTSLLFRILGGRRPLPIINVFRFQDGKIVEVWNHRHDIDWAWGNILFYQGLGVGLLIALPGWGIAVVSWRRNRKRRQASGAG